MGDLPPKLFFRIGEVAGLVGVEPHVLRYWEREFRSIRPTKSAKGQRVYSRKDVENLLRVRDLLYRDGFTIAGAKKRLHHPTALAAPEPADTDRDLEVDDGEGDDLRSEPAPAATTNLRREEAAAGLAQIKSSQHRSPDARTSLEIAAPEHPGLETAARSSMSGDSSSQSETTRAKLLELRDEVSSFLEELSRR